jgi:hypothetical protein
MMGGKLGSADLAINMSGFESLPVIWAKIRLCPFDITQPIQECYTSLSSNFFVGQQLSRGGQFNLIITIPPLFVGRISSKDFGKL